MKKRNVYLIPGLICSLLATLGTFAFLFGNMDPGVRFFLMILLWVLLFCAGKLFSEKHGAKETIMKISLFCMFLLYVVFLFSVTLFDPAFGRTGALSFLFTDQKAMEEYLSNYVNLTPFETISRYLRAYALNIVSLRTVLTNLAGNLAALAPMGMFLPILSKKCRNFLCFFAVTGITVLFIEGLQLLFMTGSCDIDDLILNLAGACTVWLILAIKPVRKAVLRWTGIR